MVTDDERREVARRLRESVPEGDVYCSRVLQWGSNDRPAPLPVDPDGFCAWGEGSGRVMGPTYSVDVDALLALADEMEEFGNLPVKHPGVRVLHNEDFSRELGYARRIREALGVES